MTDVKQKEYVSDQENEEQVIIFMSKLNIFRKNMRIYPFGHNTIHHAGRSLSAMLNKIFTLAPSITINAIKHHLVVNGKLLDSKIIHINSFAVFISRLGIASLSLKKGITGEELEHLLQLTMKIPTRNHIYQHKDILNEINSIDHIQLREIDLSSVRFTDEDITDSSDSGARLTIWQKLMLGCLSPELMDIQDAALLKTIKLYDQGSIKTFFQDFNIPEKRLIESYNAVLKSHFQAVSRQEDESQEKQQFFSSMQNILNLLSPELKEQILSTTFDTINNAGDEKALEETLYSMPGDMILEVLTQAVLNKKVMSPMLIKLLSVLYRAGKKSPEPGEEKTSPRNPVWDRIEELFSKAGYEKYLSEEYADQLQNFALGTVSEQDRAPAGFPGEKYKIALQGQNVNRHLSTALLFLMGGNIEEHIYSGYADKISQLIPDLLEQGDYQHLTTIYTILKKQMEKDKGPVAYNATVKTLNTFLTDSFTSQLALTFNAQSTGQNRDFEKLIMITGGKNLPWLIDQFLKERNAKKARETFNLIARFGPKAAEAAMSRIPGGNDEQIIKLLKLIRSSKSTVSSAQIRQLLKSKNIEVRLEAVKNLIELNDSDAINTLRELAHYRNNETAFKALKVIHDYKVQELTRELAIQIKTFYISRPAFARNKAILSLLGRLGSVEALSILRKKARVKFSITPRLLRQTQEYLYKTLIGYPQAATESFMRHGKLSRNKNIVNICNKLSSRAESSTAEDKSSLSL